MSQVQISREDIPAIQAIYDTLATALGAVPAPLAAHAKFGLLAMMAIINIACRVAMKTGVRKEEFLRSVNNIWDSKATDMAPASKPN